MSKSPVPEWPTRSKKYTELRVVEKNGAIFAAVVLCLAVTIAQAGNTVYVDAASPNDPGSGTFEDPFRRIQDGIDYSVSGDTVMILPGVYTGLGNYDLDPNGKAITINSIAPEDAWVVANTVINPNTAGRGFYIHRGEDANCVISGLTIKNAHNGKIGAGISCEGSSPAIINCSIIDNNAEPNTGGAVFCSESNSLFVNCTISGNYAYDGGGIECWSASPTLINCIISNNRTTRYGGGVDCYYSNPNIVNCTISGNYASDGGGIECWSGSPSMINCIISNNRTTRYGGGVDCFHSNPNIVNCSFISNTVELDGRGGAISLWGSNVNVKNSILWANDAKSGPQLYLSFKSSVSLSYCDIQGGISDVCSSDSNVIWGDGNIDTDPCFASFDPNGDPNLWDLHLQSSDGRWNPTFYRIDLNKNGIINLVDFAMLADVWQEQGSLPEDIDNSGMVDWMDIGLFAQYFLANIQENGWIMDATTSPCIDAGDPNSDWANEPWPNGKRINMGAYGGTNQASKSGNIADFNIDGIVNFFDLAELGKMWGENQEIIEDLNGNGTVDIGDLDILAENWLWEKQ